MRSGTPPGRQTRAGGLGVTMGGMTPAPVGMITGTASPEEDRRALVEQDELAAFGIRTPIVGPGAFGAGLFRPGAAIESAELPAYADVARPARAYLRGRLGRPTAELDEGQAVGRDTAVEGA